EAFDGNLLPALPALAVRPVVDPLQRGVDVCEHLLRVVLERVVDLAGERVRRAIAQMVLVRRGEIVVLVVERARVLGVRMLHRALDAHPLLEEDRTEVLEVDAHERLSFLARVGADADVRRRSMSVGPTPVSSTILSRALWPETIATASRGTASAFAS